MLKNQPEMHVKLLQKEKFKKQQKQIEKQTKNTSEKVENET